MSTDTDASTAPTCVIAEDEEILRSALESLLREAWPELSIVASCDDGGSAVEAIAEHHPDVAFLDIRMPGLTGLEVAAAAADTSPRTQVVFVTAYDQYAIEAFDNGAVDYLLKPVTRDRLDATVQRLQVRSAGAHPDAATLAALIRQLDANRVPDKTRSDQRSVGKACLSTCRLRMSPYHVIKNIIATSSEMSYKT